MPLTIRAKGVSLSTATNWLFNYIVGELTPILQDSIEWRLYPMHGIFCICSFFLGAFLSSQKNFLTHPITNSLVLWVTPRWEGESLNVNLVSVYPETKGVPLEEMDAVFREGQSFPIQPTKFWISTESEKSGLFHDESEHIALVARVDQDPEDDDIEVRKSSFELEGQETLSSRPHTPHLTEGNGGLSYNRLDYDDV